MTLYAYDLPQITANCFRLNVVFVDFERSFDVFEGLFVLPFCAQNQAYVQIGFVRRIILEARRALVKALGFGKASLLCQ